MESPRLGPERITFPERLVTALHIRFFGGCLVLAFIFGPPGAILSVYMQTLSLDEAVTRTIHLFFGMQVPVWQGVVGLGLLSVLLFYLLYMIRFMRLRLVAVEPQLLSLLPEGEETFYKVFSRVSSTRPPVVIGAIIMVLFSLQAAPEVPQNFIVFGIAPINLVFLALSYPLWFVIFSTFAWVFFGSIRGLHELGKNLKLKSFHEDKMLGVRPIGSLSLSFAFTYFIGLGILALIPFVLLPNPSSPGYMWLLSLLILLGVIFFFLPLNTIHKKMLEVKNREQDALLRQLSKSIQSLNGSKKEVSELSEIWETIGRLTTALTVDITKREVAAIPTWPFDAPILGRLAAMILSIAGMLIGNFIWRQIFLSSQAINSIFYLAVGRSLSLIAEDYLFFESEN
jgi:hypothetical protein